MKKLLLILAGVVGFGHAALSQQLVNCIQATSTACNTTAQQGNGTQGDPAWLAFGKVNADMTYLYSVVPTYPIAVALGGTGATASTGTGNAVLSTSPVLVTPATTGYTIGTLPTCNSGLIGTFTYVTNAQTSPTYLGTVSTTGAVTAPVFCNGVNWVYH